MNRTLDFCSSVRTKVWYSPSYTIGSSEDDFEDEDFETDEELLKVQQEVKQFKIINYKPSLEDRKSIYGKFPS